MNTSCEEGAVSTATRGEVVSDPDATIDKLIEQRSTPNLAAMFAAAKKKGLVPAMYEYGQPV